MSTSHRIDCLRGLALVLVAGLLVCGIGFTATPAGAIANGTSLPSGEPWAALVTQANFTWGIQSGWDDQCTGTLIAQDWVLTAAHCVESSNKKTYGQVVKPSVMRVVLGRDQILSDSGGIQYTVTQIVPGPGFYSSNPVTSDYALLELKEKKKNPLPAGAAPMPLAPSGYSIPDGTGITFTGYGLLNPYLQPNKYWYGSPQQTNYLQQTLSGSYVRDSSCDTQTYICFDYVDGMSMVQHGDSGGPGMVDPSNPALLTVTDSIDGYQSVGSGYGYGVAMQDTNVADPSIHSWIDSEVGITNYGDGSILRDPSTGNSWLVESDGFRHSIPDGGTYDCLTANNDPVYALPAFTIDETPLSETSAVCYSGAIITSGNVGLGVNPTGDLNVANQSPSAQGTTTYGIRYLPTNNEFAGPGCPCEGWGVADAAVGADGYADQSTGTSGLDVVSFSSTATTADSDVHVGSFFDVRNSYSPIAGNPDLYGDQVTITNISGSALDDVVYRRLMDWDMEPTAFDEYVTIEGFGNSPYLTATTDDGFDSADPLSASDNLGATGNFVQYGPLDQGAQFDFDFGALSAGQSISFEEYYGASDNQADALSDVASVGAEAYSLGEPSLDLLGDPNTAILAFSGIGGSPLAASSGVASKVRAAAPRRTTISSPNPANREPLPRRFKGSKQM